MDLLQELTNEMKITVAETEQEVLENQFRRPSQTSLRLTKWLVSASGAASRTLRLGLGGHSSRRGETRAAETGSCS